MTALLNRWLASNRFALGSIIFIWILVRVYPVLHTEPIMFTEVWSAHKLLDYGFLERHGARISQGMWSGKLPNPGDFNYTHYPLPMLWAVTLVYAISGANGVLFTILALKLAGCVIVFKILDRYFDRFPAWFATVLFAVAPCSILLDCDTDQVATGALMWPVGAWLLLCWTPAQRTPATAPAWLCGGVMFLAGQASWFVHTLIPSLMVMTESEVRPFRQALGAILKNRVARTILICGIASFLFFLLQVVVYESDFPLLMAHLRLKMGNDPAAIPKRALITLVPLRTILFTGVPLLLGAAAGLLRWRAHRSPLVIGAMVYFPSFAITALMIPHYFYMENIVYGSLLFPTAVLTAVAVSEWRRALSWLLAALALPGIAYMHLSFSVPMISPVARTVSAFIAGHAAQNEVVLTNLEPMKPPYKSSDVNGGKATEIVSDRLIFFGYNRVERLDDVPKILKHADVPLLFIVDRSRPIAPEFLDKLTRDAKLISTGKIDFPPAELNVAEKIRAFIWYKVMRKGKPADDDSASATREHTFEVYRLK